MSISTTTSLHTAPGLFTARGSALRRRRVLQTIVGIIGGTAVMGSASAAEEVRLATTTINDNQSESINLLGKALDQQSKGFYKSSMFPASQLGNNARQTEGVAMGTIQIGVQPGPFYTNIDRRYELMSSPGIFRDLQHAIAVMKDKEWREQFLNIGLDKGLRGIGLFLYSATSFATHKKITRIADFSGLKIRVMNSEVQRAITDALGAVAVPIQVNEVVTALQQGMIDGVSSGTPMFSSFQLFDTVKYVVQTNEAIIPELVVVSESWYQKQTKEHQSLIIGAMQGLEDELNTQGIAQDKKSQDTWRQHGGTITSIVEDERIEFMKKQKMAAEGVYKKYPEEEKMYQQLLAAAARN